MRCLSRMRRHIRVRAKRRKPSRTFHRVETIETWFESRLSDVIALNDNNSHRIVSFFCAGTLLKSNRSGKTELRLSFTHTKKGNLKMYSFLRTEFPSALSFLYFGRLESVIVQFFFLRQGETGDEGDDPMKYVSYMNGSEKKIVFISLPFHLESVFVPCACSV
jgi:hypothetical protein